ncbi:DUF411 domain-containing protein [Roseomonas sp. USHLN139]|uniref:DUF411 domain-containing protein n=1 Tax=Roseomonas sp. USHLN139 TaxID=3081298 RepID=UPI003B020460
MRSVATRRTLTTGLLGLVLLPTACGGPPKVEAWRDRTCGCCGGWVEHLRAEGFEVSDNVVDAVGPHRQALGTPSDLISCHAGKVGRYALEGHVPAAAIRRLLKDSPKSVAGLSVPAMPVGVPGMEVPGAEPSTYEVVAFGSDGAWRPWMRFRGLEAV